ncbi:flagellar assembly peptidoglycan hydrolase FlgJ [Colwellia sp. RSH04]|uniref:flagellar assembly peptidoglycan hydrolase FlgJ n=1 Tax=Colwellia sp. RSH04 TaxID=2305464 RepID=UPI000E577A94|nr:flagellar assembly peptidoglycan hydrolase FlgJ [Colwellia sp. RSH04]RHW75952.1 flagellar assembly peptidoglycan hydrolase FlgJ [Colwellia sp. RSH04]
MDTNINQAHAFDQARNALELNGLNDIRAQSRSSDSKEKGAALKEAAQQFEAIFMRMLLSSMRKAQEVLESDSPFNSQSTKFYRDMHDQQMAVELSSNGTLGLTDLIVRQLGGGDDYKPSSVLRNDGNLATDKTNSRNNSLLNAMSSGKPHKAQSDIVQASYSNDELLSAQSLLNQSKAQFTTLVNNPFGSALGANSAKSIQTTSVPYATSSTTENNNVKISTPNFEQPKDFVFAMVQPAKKVQEKLGVPFEVVIAQAALETGWGQKIIKDVDGASSNNLFNIKADARWSGNKVSKDTLEFENGAMVKKTAPFRVYQSISESVNDYVNFLSTNNRYQDALQQSGNVEQFLHGLQKAGYATDPQYANKILGTLKTVGNLLTK